MPAARAKLSSVILLLRDVSRSVRFYRDGLGLPVVAESETFAQVGISDALTLDLKAAQSYAAPVTEPRNTVTLGQGPRHAVQCLAFNSQTHKPKRMFSNCAIAPLLFFCCCLSSCLQ
jgi:catechol 2,3-dioxygenase-like lactoylglutathione lyase family enzyme